MTVIYMRAAETFSLLSPPALTPQDERLLEVLFPTITPESAASSAEPAVRLVGVVVCSTQCTHFLFIDFCFNGQSIYSLTLCQRTFPALAHHILSVSSTSLQSIAVSKQLHHLIKG